MIRGILKKYKRFLWVSAIIFSALLLLTAWANYAINKGSKSYVTSDITQLPKTNVGLLLGTGKWLSDHKPNEFFFRRITAAAKLYRAGKIKYILISGDNSRVGYNEPMDMKEALILLGIPDSVIYLDYAGFRTYDSVVRAKKVFGQKRLIIISQEFHNQRAVFLARNFKMEAYGYNATDVEAYQGFKTKIREFFARAKVYLDFALGTEPKFLGEQIEIPMG